MHFTHQEHEYRVEREQIGCRRLLEELDLVGGEENPSVNCNLIR